MTYQPVYEIQEVLDHEDGLECRGCISEKSDVFEDHFPDYGVLPGVLAVDILKKSWERVHGEHELGKIERVRFTGFLRPGDLWTGRLKTRGVEGESEVWDGALFVDEKKAASVRFYFKT